MKSRKALQMQHFQAFLAVKFVQRCAIVISYDGVFLCNYVWAKSPPPVRLTFSTLPVSSWT